MKQFHLFLLIGTNPLPNLVAAIALNEQVCKYWLIYSGGKYSTKQYAENLKEAIQKEFPKIGNKIELRSLSNISSSSSIESDLRNLEIEYNENVHLHYTGGTKAMAVHTYRYLENKFYDNFSASYLDTRNFEILFDYQSQPTIEQLRLEVDIDIETMLALHSYQPTKNCEYRNSPYPEFKKQTQTIVQWIQEGKINENLLHPVENFIRKIYKGQGNVLDKIKLFNEHISKSETEGKINELNEFIENNAAAKGFLLSFNNSSLLENDKVWIPGENVDNKQLKERLKDTIGYLDGKWLEAVIAQQLNEWAQKNNLPESHWGYSLEAYNTLNSYGRNFELDAFVIIGYQLVGISITTDKGGHAKLKGFEVNHRVRQIGGDEARSILICALDEERKKQLEEDLQSFTGTSAGEIIILGQEDWLNIGNVLDQITLN